MDPDRADDAKWADEGVGEFQSAVIAYNLRGTWSGGGGGQTWV